MRAKNKAHRFDSESALAAVVVTWLKSSSWEVYQEVEASGARADIIAVRDGTLWVIECKNSFSSNVVDQAYGWLKCANRVSVAVPRGRGPLCLEMFCAGHGIGVLHISREPASVYESALPCYSAGDFPTLRKYLHERQKDYAVAGNATGHYYSQFKATCETLLSYVRSNPGVNIKVAVKAIKHHYSTNYTAVSSLVRWIDLEKVPGVSIDLETRCLYLTNDGKEI